MYIQTYVYTHVHIRFVYIYIYMVWMGAGDSESSEPINTFFQKGRGVRGAQEQSPPKRRYAGFQK